MGRQGIPTDFEIVQTGEITLNISAEDFQESKPVQHNLGYAPMFFGYWRDTDSSPTRYYLLPFVEAVVDGSADDGKLKRLFQIQVSDTFITVKGEYSELADDWSSAKTLVFDYVLFREKAQGS